MSTLWVTLCVGWEISYSSWRRIRCRPAGSSTACLASRSVESGSPSTDGLALATGSLMGGRVKRPYLERLLRSDGKQL